MSLSGDRGWMYKRTDIQGFLCMDYVAKVKAFLNFAYSNDAIVERKETETGEIIFRIKCPCTDCKNTHCTPKEVVEYHLISRGFMRNYTIWYTHGETELHETGQSSNPWEVDADHYDGMTRMVWENIYGAGFDPTFQSNSEEHEPNSKAKEFYDMLENENEALYNGCEDWSKLQAATTLLNWKSDCNVPESTFNHLLPLFKSMLSAGNHLPMNFYETKKILKELSLPKKRYDVCKNHCMVFYKDADLPLTHCRHCHAPRYKRDNIPYLVMTYMPIGERLKRLYMSHLIEGLHTTGSAGYDICRRRFEADRDGPQPSVDFFVYSHAKKGTRPGEGGESSTSGPVFVDDRARRTVENYKEYLQEKFAPEDIPLHDQECWERAVGKRKKGASYGSGKSKDPEYLLTGKLSGPLPSAFCGSRSQISSIQRLTQTVEELRQEHEQTTIQMQERYERQLQESLERHEREFREERERQTQETLLLEERLKKETQDQIAEMMKSLPNFPSPPP